MIYTVGSLLLSLSCSGALVIILICVISHAFRKKSSFRWQYYIWLFAIARLLLPFAPEGNLMGSLGEKFEAQMHLFQEGEQKAAGEGTVYGQGGTGDLQNIDEINQKLNSGDKNFDNADQNKNPANNDPNIGNVGQKTISTNNTPNIQNAGQRENPADDSQNMVNTGQQLNSSNISQSTKDAGQKENSDKNQDIEKSVQKYLLLLWLIVAIFLIIRKMTIYQCFVHYIQAGSTPVSNISSLEILSAIEQELGIKKPLELWSNPMVSSPMLIGIIHPCIVLPESTLPEKAFRYTILHELTHYKRHDLVYKWLGQLVLCIHWFNPVVYVMMSNIERLCELSCDEAVNGHLNSDEGRREYAQTLLEAMKTGGKYREHLASITLSENKKMLKERLEAIMSYEKMTIKKKLLVTVLTAGIFTSALYTGSYTANAANDTLPLETVTQPAPEAAWNAILKTSAKSDSKLVSKPKAKTSASSSLNTTSKSRTDTNATSNSKLATKSKAKTSASSSSSTSAAAKTGNNSATSSKVSTKSHSRPAKLESSTSVLKGAKKQKNDKITATQADKMALALTKKIWMWDWVAFYVPYMSDAGVKKLLPASKQADWAGSVDYTNGKKIKFTKKKINAARKNKASGSLTRKDIDKHALMIMQSNGNWDCISAMLPYMSHSGIDAVVRCYNSKQFGNKKNAKDYY